MSCVNVAVFHFHFTFKKHHLVRAHVYLKWCTDHEKAFSFVFALLLIVSAIIKVTSKTPLLTQSFSAMPSRAARATLAGILGLFCAVKALQSSTYHLVLSNRHFESRHINPAYNVPQESSAVGGHQQQTQHMSEYPHERDCLEDSLQRSEDAISATACAQGSLNGVVSHGRFITDRTSSLLVKLQQFLTLVVAGEDVALVVGVRICLGDVLPSLHQAARSLQISSLYTQDNMTPVRKTAASAHICMLWMCQEDCSPMKALLLQWRCRHLLAIEPEQNVSASAGVQLLSLGQLDIIASVVVNEETGRIRVYQHQVNCVTRQLLETREISLDRADMTMKRSEVCLRGALLRFATTAISPSRWIRYGTNPDGQTCRIGVEIEMLSAIAGGLGFEYEFVDPPNGDTRMFGSKLAGGGWTGVVGMVTNNSADVGIGDLSILLERQQAVDFSSPFNAQDLTFMAMRTPAPPRWRIIAISLPTSTWIVLGITFVGMSLVLSITSGVLREEHWLPRFCSAVLVSWATLTSQSVASEPRRGTGRCLWMIWTLGAFVIGVGYQTALTSHLLVETPGPIMTSLVQLAQSPLRVIASPFFGRSAYLTLIHREASPLARLPGKVNVLPFAYSLSLHERSLQDDAAYVANPDLLNSILQQREDGHRYYISPARFFTSHQAWVIRRGACFTSIINRALSDLLQAGLIQRWIQAAWDHPEPPLPAPRPLTRRDLSAAALALGVGMAAAFVALLMELAWSRRRRGQRKRTRPAAVLCR